MNNKIVFIVNPKSGTNKKSGLVDKIHAYFSNRDLAYEIRFTEYAGHGKEIAKELVLDKIKTIVAVGGDGSVNEIASSLIGTESSLGIIPTGSGNGFAHHFNISENIIKALDTIIENQTELVDCGRINNNHFFFSNCGFAFDAEVAKAFELHPKRGFWTYIKLCFKHYFSFSQEDLKIEINGEERVLNNCLLVNVMNTSEFGNNFVVAPNTVSNDGFLELLVLKKPPILVLPFTASRFFFKTIRYSKYAKFEKVESLNLHNLSLIQKDGDWIQEEVNSASIEVIKNAIRVVKNSK